MATVTQTGQAADAVLVVKGDGRVHGRAPFADWCHVGCVTIATGKPDVICGKAHSTVLFSTQNYKYQMIK